MNIKSRIITCMLIFTLIISGCAQTNKVNEKTEDNSLKESSQKEYINDSSITQNNLDDKEISSNDKNKMMKYIKEEGINGVNIYCDNVKLGDNISDVIEIYKEPSEHNYVPDAKGIYYNYKNYNFAFGCNKGDQIFEIRSYDKKLGKLSLNDIESYFGNPDYKNKTVVGERVIGYKISDKYKLLFVFQNETLDHYSVFYPEITANLMADDEGRQW